MMTRSWRVWLIFLGVFVAGAVTGGFVSLRLVKRPPDREDLALRIMQRYADRLHLTDAQRSVIEPHVERAAADMHRARAQAAETMQALEQAVATELTQEQLAILESMQAEQRARWKRWMEKKRELERKGHGDKPKPHDKPSAATDGATTGDNTASADAKP